MCPASYYHTAGLHMHVVSGIYNLKGDSIIVTMYGCILEVWLLLLSCEASPYRYKSRAVFVSFMFPEEGLITESARNVTFHLLLFFFSHSTTVVCTRMASSKPLPQRIPPTTEIEETTRTGAVGGAEPGESGRERRLFPLRGARLP